MKRSDELFEQLESLFNELKLNHEKRSKSAHQRARKSAGEIKKLISEYRKASVAEDKAVIEG